MIYKNISPPGGLEPPTFRLTAERASQLRHGGLCLSYSRHKQYMNFLNLMAHCKYTSHLSWSRCWKTCLPAPPMFPGFISRHWYTYQVFLQGKQCWNFALKWTKEKILPTPGVEPGPPGWKPDILAVRPRGRGGEIRRNSGLWQWQVAFSSKTFSKCLQHLVFPGGHPSKY